MEIKTIGNQYSQYGSSTFYKGLRLTIPSTVKTEVINNNNKCLNQASAKDSCEDEKKSENERSITNNCKTFIIAMGDCIPVRPWADSPIECLAEVRMIWRDKTEQSLLLSLRLFFLPENTPKGRNNHGEDEVVAVKDLESPRGRIVIRAEDFTSWVVEDLQWNWGLTASFHDKSSTKLTSSSNGIPVTSLLSNSKLDFSEVEKEKEIVDNLHSNVTILSYSRYCRYRATLKRLEHIEDNQIRIKLIETLSGFVASQPNTRIMFAKETIDYPDLESHEMLCPHLAPKLKGRPRGRRLKITSRVSECSSPAPSSEFSVDSGETNDSDVFDGKHLMKNKDNQKMSQRLTRNKRKSESIQTEIYTTLSTGRVSKQRLPLSPLKSVTNKRKKKSNESDDEPDSSSSEDNNEDEDYDDKYVNRKMKQESGSKRKVSLKDDENGNERNSVSIMNLIPALQIPIDAYKSPEELDFLIRLNNFMTERAQSYPKLVWSLRDVNLFTIYTRVQKLGGFDAIADNRVWKNLFEDLSEPGKCITQGMTKRKYERILLPFERFERELRENGKYKSELTISTIPKGKVNHRESQFNRNQNKRPRSSSPAIEIIPLKNGSSDHSELTFEQINEIQNIIKPKDYENQHFYNGHSNDGVSVPVHVIVRPTTSTSIAEKIANRKRGFENQNNSYSFTNNNQQKPKEKENIPMMPSSTTIVPLKSDGFPTFSPTNVVELIDSDDESNCRKGNQNMKKRKLDILREGGLEVTPISRRAQDFLMTYPHHNPGRSNTNNMQPNVSLMSLSPARAPPVIQSFNMYQSTSQVFKNPKEDVINATRSSKLSCLDLTSKTSNEQQHSYPQSSDMFRDVRKNLLSIEEVQKNYRGSNPDLQITLVKPNPDSSVSNNNNNNNNNSNQKVVHQTGFNRPSTKKLKKVPSQTLPPGIPPINPVIIAAANELQKLQQRQNMPPLFPFLSGLDITPLQQSTSSRMPKPSTSSPSSEHIDNALSYLSALYSNPLLQGSNILSPAAEFLKLYTSSTSANRVPSSKN